MQVVDQKNGSNGQKMSAINKKKKKKKKKMQVIGFKKMQVNDQKKFK